MILTPYRQGGREGLQVAGQCIAGEIAVHRHGDCVVVLAVYAGEGAADLEAIAAAHDPSVNASPPAAECRTVARPIVEAVASLGA